MEVEEWQGVSEAQKSFTNFGRPTTPPKAAISVLFVWADDALLASSEGRLVGPADQ
jgi:hypothetical protein